MPIQNAHNSLGWVTVDGSRLMYPLPTIYGAPNPASRSYIAGRQWEHDQKGSYCTSNADQGKDSTRRAIGSDTCRKAPVAHRLEIRFTSS